MNMLKKDRKERLVWFDLMITLLSMELMSYFYYGMRSIVLGGICVSVSLAAEFLCLRGRNRKFTADDLTCTSDALIIALMMPSVMDFKIAVIASVFAVVAAKNVFGGRQNMIFSPAAAAYVFILTSWGRQMLLYAEPHVKTGIFEEPENLVSSASYLYNTTGKMEYTDFEILMGNFSGPVGAVSILLLIISAVMLLLKRDISAGAFIGTVAGTVLFSAITPIADSRMDSVKYTLVTNMLLFASIYIISDRRIAPKRQYFAFFYGFFIAVFSYVLLITTAQENVIVTVSVLFTPVALAFKNLEKKIDLAKNEEAPTENASDASEALTSVPEITIQEADDTEVAELIEELSAIPDNENGEGVENE